MAPRARSGTNLRLRYDDGGVGLPCGLTMKNKPSLNFGGYSKVTIAIKSLYPANAKALRTNIATTSVPIVQPRNERV
jgi:hypothetical protein